MAPDRRLFWLAAALSLACGGVLSAAPSPSGSAPPGLAPSSSAAPGLGLSWRGEPVHLKAEKLRVDLAARRAELEGRVELRRADATLRCARVELSFDERGQVTSARGSGGVSLDARDLHAEAAEASFDLDHQALKLRGTVRLTRGGLRLTAAAASVDLAAQRVELTEVEGSLAAPAASAAPAPSASR